jgi:hypothetical protein
MPMRRFITERSGRLLTVKRRKSLERQRNHDSRTNEKDMPSGYATGVEHPSDELIDKTEDGPVAD